MGKPWAEQQLGCSVLDVLEEVRQSIREGDLRLATWDHNHPDRVNGRSNKQIMIAGARLLGTSDLSYGQAKTAVLEAVVGRAS